MRLTSKKISLLIAPLAIGSAFFVLSPKPLVISGLVIPHHNLVQNVRQDFLRQVAAEIKEPRTIILVSPNHFSAGDHNIQTTDQTWNLSNGTIEPNKDVLKALQTIGVSDEPSSFVNEHGIKTILPDIKTYFPHSQVISIILKIDTPSAEINKLHDALQQACPDCLLVASVDFSHYQPALLANLHDELTLRALQNLDTNLMRTKAEVDSPPALELLMDWAASHGTDKFTLARHTNSGELAKNPDQETTTHLFGYYESGPKAVPQASASFIMGGDVMFGRSIASAFPGKKLVSVLDQLGDRVFWGTDGSAINLEGAVSPVPVPAVKPNSFSFIFPPETIQSLKYLHINIASQANNHSDNAGLTGASTTYQLLKAAGLNPMGGPRNVDAENIAVIPGQGLTLYFIGAQFLNNTTDLAPIIKKIKQDPQSRVIIYPHWGVEYQSKHNQAQAKLAHQWIEAGADLIVGSHPHVIQDAEVYQGKPIIYSLGNLLFDQTFSVPTQQSLLIAGSFTDSGLTLFALPTMSQHYKPQLATGTLKQTILNQLYAPLSPYRQDTPAGATFFFPK